MPVSRGRKPVAASAAGGGSHTPGGGQWTTVEGNLPVSWAPAPGEVLEGVVTATGAVTFSSRSGPTRYLIVAPRDEADQPVTIWETAQLSRFMEVVTPQHEVRIVYRGETRLDRGRRIREFSMQYRSRPAGGSR